MIFHDMATYTWDDIKSEVYRIYMVENKTVGKTRAIIQGIYGFKTRYVNLFAFIQQADVKQAVQVWRNR